MSKRIPIENLLDRLMECGIKYPDQIKEEKFGRSCRLLWKVEDDFNFLEIETNYISGLLATTFHCRRTKKRDYHRSFQDMLTYLEKDFSELFGFEIKEPDYY